MRGLFCIVAAAATLLAMDAATLDLKERPVSKATAGREWGSEQGV